MRFLPTRARLSVAFALLVGTSLVGPVPGCSSEEPSRRQGPPPAFPKIIYKKKAQEPAPAPKDTARSDDWSQRDVANLPPDEGDEPDGARAEEAPSNGDEDVMRVHTLNIGQGAATLLEFACGAMLVDTGGERNSLFSTERALIDELNRFFKRRRDLKHTLDLLWITHPHIDHMRGIPALLDAFKVRNVVDNGHDGDDLVKTEMERLRGLVSGGSAKYRGISLSDVPAKKGLHDDVIDPINCSGTDPDIRALWGGLTGDPGWGQNKYGRAHFDNENNHSVVARITFGAASMLITGDLEEHAIEELVARYEGGKLLDVDIYAVGHHGSHNGTTRNLMAAMSPKVALISMGDSARQKSWTAWQYGHPRQPAVELVLDGVSGKRPPFEATIASGTRRFYTQRITQAVYGTGWEGTVTLEASSSGRIRHLPKGVVADVARAR